MSIMSWLEKDPVENVSENVIGELVREHQRPPLRVSAASKKAFFYFSKIANRLTALA
jgi:hypothetical protein